MHEIIVACLSADYIEIAENSPEMVRYLTRHVIEILDAVKVIQKMK